MNIFSQFLAQYGAELIKTIVFAILGFVGIVIKNLYNRYINDETKRSIVKTCVYAVEQLYKNLHGEEKLNKCIVAAAKLLQERGIVISEDELRLLIESAVGEMNINKLPEPEVIIAEGQAD